MAKVMIYCIDAKGSLYVWYLKFCVLVLHVAKDFEIHFNVVCFAFVQKINIACEVMKYFIFRTNERVRILMSAFCNDASWRCTLVDANTGCFICCFALRAEDCINALPTFSVLFDHVERLILCERMRHRFL